MTTKKALQPPQPQKQPSPASLRSPPTRRRRSSDFRPLNRLTIRLTHTKKVLQLPLQQPQPTQQPSSAPLRSPPTRRRRSSDFRPLNRLTIGLTQLYQKINDTSKQQKQKQQQQLQQQVQAAAALESFDDAQGDYIIKQGDILCSRYEIRALLGRGSFGQVVRCRDRLTSEEVAVKVLFYKQACIEVELLKKLNSYDPGDHYKIVRCRDHFKHRGHLCIVFELLSYNLYELLSITQFTGVSLHLVKKFALQILTALSFLASDSIRIIHADLKPENILLRNPKRSAIKIIDFGSSCACGQNVYKYIQSRYYRSPEVILGLPYGCAIDMWSLGAILVEMHVGDPIFNGKNEAEQLVKIASIIGLPPQAMIEQSPKSKKLFVKNPVDGTYSFIPSLQTKFSQRRLSDILGVETGGPKGRRRGDPGHSVSDYLRFKDLIEKMLVYDPTSRITPIQALHHSFFRQTADEMTVTSPALSRVTTNTVSTSTSTNNLPQLSQQIPIIQSQQIKKQQSAPTVPNTNVININNTTTNTRHSTKQKRPSGRRLSV